MKKILYLLLFIPLISFGQNDFRKMFWGESKEVLKEKYPDVGFVTITESGIEMLSHFDNAVGLPASITYMFFENKLVGGVYKFHPMSFSRDDDDRLKDFKYVAERLDNKYELSREDVWHNDRWKDDPQMLAYCVELGDVDLIQNGFIDDKKVGIAHSLTKDEHTLGYIIKDGFVAVEQSIDDDI